MVAGRYLDGRPRVELSVVGRPRATAVVALDRSAVPASAPPSGFRPPAPRIITLAGNIPLWVFARGDLPTVTGSIVVAGGAGHQAASQAGLAQLTLAMLDEGTVSRSAEQIALAAESMGEDHQRGLRLGRVLRLFQMLEKRPSAESRSDGRHSALSDVSGPRVAAGAGPDAGGPSRRTRQRRGTRLPGLAPGPLSRATSVPVSTRRNRSQRRRHPTFRPGSVSCAVPRARPGDDRRRRRRRPRHSGCRVERRLEAWRARRRLAGPAGRAQATRPRLLVLDRPGAQQAVIRAGHLGIARSSTSYDHALVVNHILGGQFTSRLNTRLREERGLTYGIRSRFDCRRLPGPFSISACGPERTAYRGAR